MTTDTPEESHDNTVLGGNPSSHRQSTPLLPLESQSQHESAPSSSSTHSPTERSSSCDSKFFKCNICLETPVDPIVTVCGHMYCWRCILAWLDHGSGQCPVCKAGVTKSNVIPVYGGGKESSPSAPHPASKEGQESEQRRQEKEARPRAERPEPSSRRHGWHATSHGVQFGLFPFGVGIQFGSTRLMGGSRDPPLTRSQLMSTALIVFGILVIFWAAFIEPLFTNSF